MLPTAWGLYRHTTPPGIRCRARLAAAGRQPSATSGENGCTTPSSNGCRPPSMRSARRVCTRRRGSCRAHRGRPSRSAAARCCACAPTTTWGCRTTQGSSKPLAKPSASTAWGCRACASSAARRTCTSTLEQKVSDVPLGTEDTILYTSCFDANGGLFETLIGPEDAIISDALNHASIIDGVRLCKAKRFRYAEQRHGGPRACLKEAAAGARSQA